MGDHVIAPGKNWQRALEKHRGAYVLLGVAEDIGVRANFGRPGAHSAFAPALSAFLNQQHNAYFESSEVMVLGEEECSDLMRKAVRVKGASA